MELSEKLRNPTGLTDRKTMGQAANDANDADEVLHASNEPQFHIRIIGLIRGLSPFSFHE
jgi:hypothetical protein